MKNKDEIFATVSSVLAAEFELKKQDITLNTHLFQELGLDSIDAIDLVVRLQEIVGKRIDPETFKQVRTVNDVVNAIDDIVNT